MFDLFAASRADIDAAFGPGLRWERLDDGQASKIVYVVSGSYKSDEAEWAKIQGELVGGMNRLVQACRPVLDNLRMGSVEQGSA